MSQPIHFLPPDLARWDAGKADALVLTFFSDERPLRGAAGLADWRLCGRLSRLLKGEKMRGKRGETMMTTPAGRLPFPRIVLFGLGDSGRFDETRYREHVRWIRMVLDKARVRTYALQPPGRATGLIAARRALELWLEEADKDRAPAEVTLVETLGGQKEMHEALRVRKALGGALPS